jgi:hypothetical protein
MAGNSQQLHAAALSNKLSSQAICGGLQEVTLRLVPILHRQLPLAAAVSQAPLRLPHHLPQQLAVPDPHAPADTLLRLLLLAQLEEGVAGEYTREALEVGYS